MLPERDFLPKTVICLESIPIVSNKLLFCFYTKLKLHKRVNLFDLIIIMHLTSLGHSRSVKLQAYNRMCAPLFEPFFILFPFHTTDWRWAGTWKNKRARILFSWGERSICAKEKLTSPCGAINDRSWYHSSIYNSEGKWGNLRGDILAKAVT